MTATHHHNRSQSAEREQLELFRALPGDLAPRDAQDLMAYPFFSLAKSKRTTPIDFRLGAIAIKVEAAAEHGMATISESGFGHDVRDALEARAEHLVAEGLARRQGQRIIFARDLLDTLRNRELDAAGARIAAENGLPRHAVTEGETVAGVYRNRLMLSSGRFAMIDDGLGFQLVPWSPSLEKEIGKQVSGVMSPAGGVDWSFGRKRGIGR